MGLTVNPFTGKLGIGTPSLRFNPLAGEFQFSGGTNRIVFDPKTRGFSFAGISDPIPAIPGLVLRWQSWSAGTFLNGSGDPAADFEEVETIVDISGNSNDGTQALFAKQGIWRDAQINGHGALECDPVDDGYGSPCILNGEYTIFVVSNTQTGGGIRTVNGAPGNRLISTSRNNAAVFVGAVVVSDLSAFADTWAIGCLRISTVGTSSNFRLNGVDITESAAVVAEWGNVDLGAVGGVPEPTNGQIAFVAAFNRPLDLDEVEIVESYLSNQTGIPIP